MSEATRAKKVKKPDVKIIEIGVSPDVEEYLDLEVLLKLLKVSRSTFKLMVAEGEYPQPDARHGNRDKWLKSTHNAHLRGVPKPGPVANPFEGRD